MTTDQIAAFAEALIGGPGEGKTLPANKGDDSIAIRA